MIKKRACVSADSVLEILALAQIDNCEIRAGDGDYSFVIQKKGLPEMQWKVGMWKIGEVTVLVEEL